LKESWDDCSVESQADILAFDQTAQHDEIKRQEAMLGAGKPRPAAPPKGKRRKR
jgi:hypothetical protein